MDFNDWIVHQGRSEKTAKNYTTAMSGRLAIFKDLLKQSDFDAGKLAAGLGFEGFCDEFDLTKELLDVNLRSKDMYRCALVWYRKYLVEQSMVLQGNQNHLDMTSSSSAELFPEGLIRWSGHHDGGVRRPFKPDSGRPTGEQIETPLVKRLRNWIRSLVAGEDVPRVMLLVGGPGNGKTDSVEGCIEYFDAEIKANGTLTAAFAELYDVDGGQLQPRKSVVDLSNVESDVLPDHLRTSITLVQDATEGDPSQNLSPEELLLNELDTLLNPDHSGIYLCCVNRGILASAAEIAYETNYHSDVSSLLNTVVESVTSSPTPPDCWPLKGYENVALWPMDIESLVDKSLSDDHRSVAHQIFEVALSERRWKEPCELKTRCPFCQNRKLLTTGKALDALVDILHYYEVTSGKRWTFRDIFSLVPHLLVGSHSGFEIKGKRHSPCEWAAQQYKFAMEGKVGSLERDRAPFLLMSHLYHHRLFPNLPRFDSGDHRKAKRALLKARKGDEGLTAAYAFFRFAASSKQLIMSDGGDVPTLVQNKLGIDLDPSLAKGAEVLITRSDVNVTVEEVEDNFSLSTADGLKLVSSQIETLERDVLERLSMADESLIEDRFPRSRTKQARVLQSTLRQYSSRLVKRSLGTKHGVCQNLAMFKLYLAATRQTEVLNDARKGLRSLLNDSDNKFRAGLATTFGQPVAHRSRDVSLVLETACRVGIVEQNRSTKRPIDYLPYLVVDKHYVALTFNLFGALNEVNQGLHVASLQGEIYSLLDRVKSLVSGRVVRDKKELSEEPVIVLGSSPDVIEFVNNKFVFSKRKA